MARTKQTACKQPTPRLSTRQVEVSTSEEEDEEGPVAKKKPKSKAKKREANSSVTDPDVAAPPPKKPKKPSRKSKEEAATPGTLMQKKAPAAKKETEKGTKRKASPQDAGKKSKAKKERYICPVYWGDEEPPTDAKERKRNVRIEYSTDDKVSETLLDEASAKGEYVEFDTGRIKRVKRDVNLTLPTSPKAAAYPETFVAWYKDHGMTVGMRSALQGAGWTEEDIEFCKARFIKKYGVSSGYKVRYPGKHYLKIMSPELEDSQILLQPHHPQRLSRAP